ncbi:helix-turn-helix transcriptional regulator [Paenibacillus sp. M1]|uniref:Helix-turn-helix transcriptional regulator n=1 Tax=Paenibacillus haidiansis TaxID=1574488 RepID=A0ABU7VP61_9BACL
MVPNATPSTVKTLREWRAYRRLPKAQIAKILSVHPSTYAKMEDRPGDVSMNDARILAEIFECRLEEINFFD